MRWINGIGRALIRIVWRRPGGGPERTLWRRPCPSVPERLIPGSGRALGQSFTIDVHIGHRLRRQRRALGLSQKELADAIGVGFQQVQKYESGLNKLSAARLWALAVALGVSPNYFFEGLTREALDR